MPGIFASANERHSSLVNDIPPPVPPLQASASPIPRIGRECGLFLTKANYQTSVSYYNVRILVEELETLFQAPETALAAAKKKDIFSHFIPKKNYKTSIIQVMQLVRVVLHVTNI